MPGPAPETLKRLSRSTLALYGLPNLVSSVSALPVALFLPAFYSDDLGLPLAAVGVALTFSRVLDLATDPWIGAASDAARTRFGRRKPWIALSAPLLVLSAWQLFVPGERGGVGVGHLALWSALLYLAWTAFDLPYKAWGAELSADYSERSRVAAWREALGFTGQIGLLLLLFALARAGVESTAAQLRALAIAITLGLPPLVALALWRVPEAEPDASTENRLGFARGLQLVAANPAFARMVGAVLCFVSGVFVQGTLHKLVLTHRFGRPELFPPMILFENVATLAAVPLWLGISERIGKHRAVALAALWLGAFSLALPLFRAQDGWAFVAWMTLRGSSFASILFLANSMAADVVDHDQLISGRQRTGLYFGVWGMVIKAAIALGLLLATALPAVFGFDPGRAAPDASALRALMAVYALLPGVLMAAGAPFLWHFPIDREAQARLRAALVERRTMRAPDAPL